VLKKFNKRDRARLFWATTLSFALLPIGEIAFDLSSQFSGIEVTSPAYAKRSGGRSGGGSFRSSGSRSSSGSSSSRSNSNNSGSSSHTYYHHTTYRRGYYGYGSTSSTFAWGIFWIIFTLFALVLVAVLLSQTTKHKTSKREREIDNKIVTVSQIQIALLAQAKSIQNQLSAISLSIDPNTSEGLSQLLQESILALLRSPENWQYVLASSQKCDRDRAETIFNQLSIQQRSKFSAETLVNVAGRRSQQESVTSNSDDSAEYIVVTLLIGTAHDKSFFSTIRTAEALKQALETIAAIDPEYLLKFELLWTPQSETDSLSYVELLSEYADMVPL
jgi:uncharacterized membrane protein